LNLLQLMERVGSRKTKLIIGYVQDALNEMQTIIPETVTRSFLDIEADTRLYSLPTTMIKLLGVYRKYDDDEKYIRIGRIQGDTLEQDSTASSSSTDDDIIVI